MSCYWPSQLTHLVKHLQQTTTSSTTLFTKTLCNHIPCWDEHLFYNLRWTEHNETQMLLTNIKSWSFQTLPDSYINPRDSPEFPAPQHDTDEDHHEKNRYDKSQRPQQLIYTHNNTIKYNYLMQFIILNVLNRSSELTSVCGSAAGVCAVIGWKHIHNHHDSTTEDSVQHKHLSGGFS